MTRKRLQIKKGVSNEPEISADSTVGKNKRVWAPEDALDQAKFHFTAISQFISLFLWVRNEVLAGGTDVMIFFGISSATCREE
jgi:hypothetical protein